MCSDPQARSDRRDPAHEEDLPFNFPLDGRYSFVSRESRLLIKRYGRYVGENGVM